MTSTPLRLMLDFGMQSLIFALFLLSLFFSPEAYWFHLAWFGLALSAWQVGQAWYEVEKYQTWAQGAYLAEIKLVTAYFLLITLIAGLMVLLSAGWLWPFGLFVGRLLYMAFCILLPFMALRYFYRSLQRLYWHFRRPRSFWDL